MIFSLMDYLQVYCLIFKHINVFKFSFLFLFLANFHHKQKLYSDLNLLKFVEDYFMSHICFVLICFLINDPLNLIRSSLLEVLDEMFYICVN